jgi:hypothetical protein
VAFGTSEYKKALVVAALKYRQGLLNPDGRIGPHVPKGGLNIGE